MAESVQFSDYVDVLGRLADARIVAHIQFLPADIPADIIVVVTRQASPNTPVALDEGDPIRSLLDALIGRSLPGA